MTEKFNKKIAYDILRIRLGQIVINEEYKKGNFKIPIHLAFGHESIAVAISNIMENNDKLILSHRNIAYNLAREGSLKPILDEYFLKPTGLMKGQFGSMNLINPSKGVVYSSSILGNNFSVAVGTAMAQKIMADDGVTLVLGGDGSIEEGSFHESLLMFKSLKLSGMIIIENNGWSMSTRIQERRAPLDLEKFLMSYNIKYEKLEGNDPYDYIKKLSNLRKDSLKTHEPVCIEVNVTTLGDWRMKTSELPDGKFVNYHAGPTPSIDIKNWPNIIRENNEDPLFVLKEYFEHSEFDEMLNEIKNEITKEIS